MGLPSQLGQSSDPPSYGSLQLQGLLAESWLQGQEQLRGLSLPHRADRHSCQAVAVSIFGHMLSPSYAYL